MSATTSEIRDGMRIDWDVPIPMDDGLVLRADVFRPVAEGRYPAILSYGPYGKGLAFQEGYKTAWEIMARENPDAVAGTSNKYRTGKSSIPEKWVPDGYACVRVDSRGAGRSPGYLGHNNARENRDFHDCIEWTAAQPWCSGKVGLNGISYYAAQPVARRGDAAAAPRRDLRVGRLGRLLPRLGAPRRHHLHLPQELAGHAGEDRAARRGERGPKSRVTGELVCGPETLSEEELAQNREDMWAGLPRAPARRAVLPRAHRAISRRVTVPLLSAANWGGQGLHPRGNFEGFTRAASQQKWLEVHGGSHWAPFYTDYGVELQKRFFDYFLKGEQNGWDRQPRVHAAGAPPRREIRRAPRERMAARAHAVDELLSRSARHAPLARAGAAAETRHLRRAGRRRDLLDAAARAGDRDHRAPRR